MSEYITPPEAAAELDISHQAVTTWIKSDRLPAQKQENGRWLIRRDHWNRWKKAWLVVKQGLPNSENVPKNELSYQLKRILEEPDLIYREMLIEELKRDLDDLMDAH